MSNIPDENQALRDVTAEQVSQRQEDQLAEKTKRCNERNVYTAIDSVIESSPYNQQGGEFSNTEYADILSRHFVALHDALREGEYTDFLNPSPLDTPEYRIALNLLRSGDQTLIGEEMLKHLSAKGGESFHRIINQLNF